MDYQWLALGATATFAVVGFIWAILADNKAHRACALADESLTYACTKPSVGRIAAIEQELRAAKAETARVARMYEGYKTDIALLFHKVARRYSLIRGLYAHLGLSYTRVDDDQVEVRGERPLTESQMHDWFASRDAQQTTAPDEVLSQMEQEFELALAKVIRREQQRRATSRSK